MGETTINLILNKNDQIKDLELRKCPDEVLEKESRFYTNYDRQHYDDFFFQL